jgi:hypothetical protein
VDRIVDQVSQPSYASSSVSALLCWQQLSQGPIVGKGDYSVKWKITHPKSVSTAALLVE